jgi:hypothetical protein
MPALTGAASFTLSLFSCSLKLDQLPFPFPFASTTHYKLVLAILRTGGLVRTSFNLHSTLFSTCIRLSIVFFLEATEIK